jgi:hypothetical protein
MVGMRKVSQADLDALNFLVQDGLIEVVSIDEFGEPSYRLASRFTAEQNARTGESPGVRGSSAASLLVDALALQRCESAVR